KRVLTIFVSTMILWISRSYINALIPGITLSDAGISMLASLALFTIPFRFSLGEFILEWKDTVKLPWGILILFGGGLALASAMSSAGVIDYIGQLVSENKALSAVVVGTVLIAIMLFMTELMSNVALVAIFSPVIAGIAMGLDQEVLYLLMPIAMASSCAFMLPMATPPNAIVFASGYIKVHQMARAGILLNIASIMILTGFMIYIIPRVF
ncbi:MAG: SLC13 family permease, partial [Bacteroidota bacterium]